MNPGKFNLTGDRAIYQGDTYVKIAQITLPDLTEFDGPADLSSATVTAQVRNEAQELLGNFDVEIINAATRKIRPTMSPEVSAGLPLTDATTSAYWDLQVSEGEWVGTILRGSVSIVRQETQ